MPTREEIREGIQQLTGDYCSRIMSRDWFTPELTKSIFKYLHSQGVVIKVDRDKESVLIPFKGHPLQVEALMNISTASLEEAGYVAVEPLIPFVARSGIIQAVGPLIREE